MSNRIKKRIKEYRNDLEKRVSEFNNGAAGKGDLVRGCVKDTQKLARKLVKPKPSRERKKAIHLLHQGMDEYNRQSYRAAISSFRKSLEKDNAYARAWAYLGNALYMQGRFTEAIEAWQHAVDAEPGSSAAEMASEKLLRLGHGKEGLTAMLRKQRDQRI